MLTPTSTCQPMNGTNYYYTLLTTTNNEITKALLNCQKQDCTQCTYELGKESLGSCIDVVDKESVRLSKQSLTCLGGSHADASSLYAAMYYPAGDDMGASCNVSASDPIDMLNIGPADNKCRPVAIMQGSDSFYVSAKAVSAGVIDLNLGCDVNCTNCVVVATNYTLQTCNVQADGYGVSVWAGDHLPPCGKPPSPSKKKKSSNAGAVAGGTIGAIAGLVLMAIVYVKFIRGRKSEYTAIQ